MGVAAGTSTTTASIPSARSPASDSLVARKDFVSASHQGYDSAILLTILSSQLLHQELSFEHQEYQEIYLEGQTSICRLFGFVVVAKIDSDPLFAEELPVTVNWIHGRS
eukprot:GHVU01167018.1.p3 GENE.GHVU01167018.1~~GHVU01167018.1.p3  ORF type:complete len:109 (+),score=0.73 GHVU01167018.1:598-924(+)